ncbi:hypothetical protein KTN05_07585 [Paracoccus sp. Z118]|uniref:hypothetical protein n=1 Tax=Paracoccus sp. Z118 TaxID=2851017 RepID=UPI001C2BE5BE|nr:hypothetical protein [Paracoccus sp. Z118]MBV0891714.1 hypothetical protein [Paracoccus sp. Z118]
MLVADVIMEPAETPLLAEAKARGARIDEGPRMPDGQIAEILSSLTEDRRRGNETPKAAPRNNTSTGRQDLKRTGRGGNVTPALSARPGTGLRGFTPAIIRLTITLLIWLWLPLRNVEDLPHERGVVINQESARRPPAYDEQVSTRCP